MMKLWGIEVDVEPEPKPKSDQPPNHNGILKLPKKCRRLLIAACRKGSVTPKDGDAHFLNLVTWGILKEDGTPTKKGRQWYDACPDDEL